MTRRISSSRPMTGSIFPGAGQRGEVAPIFFQGLEFVFGIGIGDALVAAQIGQGSQNGVALEARWLGKFFSAPGRLVPAEPGADVRC